MTRPPHEIADVIRLYGQDLLRLWGARLSAAQKLVLRALVRCRTAALGGHLERCDNPKFGARRLFLPFASSSAAVGLLGWVVRTAGTGGGKSARLRRRGIGGQSTQLPYAERRQRAIE
jgi:hypothetical protein